jgi:hypothetical protein
MLGRLMKRSVLAAILGCLALGIQASAKAVSGSALIRSPLVGQWQRVLTCQGLVAELREAGLGVTAPFAWLGQTSAQGESSFKPGSPKPTLAHPCSGAIPRLHSHFFTASAQFGSLDWKGGQVDDGPYHLVKKNTVRIGAVMFHFTIRGGKLMLSPLLTTKMIRQAVADPAKFSPAFWAVSVAYSGHSWKRVACSRCG